MTLSDTTTQPAPKPNDKPAVWGMVMQDMLDRDRFGLEKYGTRLQPFNGRDALVDAYQEALDLVVYLRTAIYERDNPASMPAEFGQQHQLNTAQNCGTCHTAHGSQDRCPAIDYLIGGGFTGRGGAMIHCPDCSADSCPCVSR